jgi:prepilin-type N-terminal cleavage/methylation domain-containing protein
MNKKIKGFTLIELLVVIAIIGILSGFVIASMTSAINAAKDARRKSDLATLGKALLIYGVNHNNSYPYSALDSYPCNLTGGTNLCTNTDLASALSLTLPADPDSSKSYTYTGIGNGANFILSGALSDGNNYQYNSISNSWASLSPINSDGACSVTSGTINLNAQSCSGRATADAVNFVTNQNNVSGATSIILSTTPTGLSVNDQVLIINLQGTSVNYANVGKYETKIVSQVNTNTLTFTQPLINTYDGTTQKIMIQRLPNYATVNISSGAILTANAWDGSKSGVLAFNVSGTATTSGTIDMNAKGFGGGAGVPGLNDGIFYGMQGASYAGIPTRAQAVNFGGGGGGYYDGGGGGGGHSIAGINGVIGHAGGVTSGGASYSSAGLVSLFLGSGGGGGGGTGDACFRPSGAGSAGAGIIFISANTLTVLSGGIIRANANTAAGGGSCGVNWGAGGGGGGAGGSIKLIASTITNSGTITVTGGAGGAGGFGNAGSGGAGGAGSAGIIYQAAN